MKAATVAGLLDGVRFPFEGFEADAAGFGAGPGERDEGEGGDETDDFYAGLVEEVAEGEEDAEEWQGHAEGVGVRERAPWVVGVVCVAVVFDRVDPGKRLEACNDLVVAGLHVVWRWGRAELHVSNQLD